MIWMLLLLAAAPASQPTRKLWLIDKSHGALPDIEGSLRELCARVGVEVAVGAPPDQTPPFFVIEYTLTGPGTAELRITTTDPARTPILERAFQAASPAILAEEIAHVSYGAVEELVERDSRAKRALTTTLAPSRPPPTIKPWRFHLGVLGTSAVTSTGPWLRLGGGITLALRYERVRLKPTLFAMGAYVPAFTPGQEVTHGGLLKVAPTITPLTLGSFSLTLGPSVGFHMDSTLPPMLRPISQTVHRPVLSAGAQIAAEFHIDRTQLYVMLAGDVLFPVAPPPAGIRGPIALPQITFTPAMVLGVALDLIK
jgi:hypothetical protein